METKDTTEIANSRGFTLASGRTFDISFDPTTQDAQLEVIRHEELAKLPEASRAAIERLESTHVTFQRDGEWVPERQQMHDAIVASYLQGHQPAAQPEIAMIGGGPASGKTTASDEARAKLTDAVYINVDEIRTVMPEFGALVGGEHVGLLNEEIGQIRDRILDAAKAHRLNIVLDGVGSPATAMALANLEEGGYKVSYYFVYRPVEEAVQLNRKRTYNTRNLADLRKVPDSTVRKFHEKARLAFPLIALPGREVKIFSKANGRRHEQGTVVFDKSASDVVVTFEYAALQLVMEGTPHINLDKWYRQYAIASSEMEMMATAY